MSAEAIEETISKKAIASGSEQNAIASGSEQNAIAGWQPPMPPTDLIFDDGEPLETNRHRIAMNALIRSLNQAYLRKPH